MNEPTGLAGNCSFIIIPDWIYKAALRNKFNTIDLADYSKLRSIMSVEDMAEIFYINSDGNNPLSFIKGVQDYCSIKGHFDKANKLTEEQTKEIDNIIVPLSGAEYIKSRVVQRLQYTGPSCVERDEIPSPLYKFITTNNRISFLILTTGILNQLTNKEYTLNFMRECLRELYITNNISLVSGSPLFLKYLQLLKPQVLEN